MADLVRLVLLVIFVGTAIATLASAISPTGPEPTSTAQAQSETSPSSSRSTSDVSRRAPTPARSAGSEGVPPAPTTSTSALVATRRAEVGLATWYCSSGAPRCTKGYPMGGHYAAAGSELQTGDWRGDRVRVCSTIEGPRCVTVTLVDVCWCPGSRVIDLYASAFGELASPSRGVIPVTVRSSSGAGLLPPTDTMRE